MIRSRRGAMLGGFLLVLAWLAGSCASAPGSYVHPNVDFSHVRRCAVLPLQNLTTDPYADDRIQSILIMEILREGELELVGPWEALAALRESALPSDAPLTSAQIKTLGAKLSVDAVFTGTVEDYGLGRGSQEKSNEVTAVFALTETETGTVIWRSQVHRTGSSVWKKLFGGGTDSLHEVSREAVRAALGTLFD